MLSKEVRFLQKTTSQYSSELNQWLDYQVLLFVVRRCVFTLQVGRRPTSHYTEAREEISRRGEKDLAEFTYCR